jgi:hypothetical protein
MHGTQRRGLCPLGKRLRRFPLSHSSRGGIDLQNYLCGLRGQVTGVSSYRYRSRRSDESLREKLVRLAREKPRYGYRRLQMLLERLSALASESKHKIADTRSNSPRSVDASRCSREGANRSRFRRNRHDSRRLPNHWANHLPMRKRPDRTSEYRCNQKQSSAISERVSYVERIETRFIFGKITEKQYAESGRSGPPSASSVSQAEVWARTWHRAYLSSVTITLSCPFVSSSTCVRSPLLNRT